MEILNYKKTEIQNSYVDFKASMDAVVERVEEGFVQIGYYLKIARDTQVLQESGYKSVTDFAAAEYGLDKVGVSRFIAINDRFAEDGYSDRLKDQYRGMGRAKLSVMLMLPEWINEELGPEYSKTDIQAIRAEVAEEEKTTDLEILMEEREAIYDRLENDLQRVLWKLGQDIPGAVLQALEGICGRMMLSSWQKRPWRSWRRQGEGMHSAQSPESEAADAVAQRCRQESGAGKCAQR